MLGERDGSQYQQSSFCLIVQGDTPTTRRLYDALASGCVPIVMGDLALTLPFTSTVEWRKIIIYAGSLNCVTRDKVEESAAWLQRLVEYVRTNRDGGEELGGDAAKGSGRLSSVAFVSVEWIGRCAAHGIGEAAVAGGGE